MKLFQIAALALLTVAHAGWALAQSPAPPPAGGWQAVTQQVMLPSWTPRPGENWLSFRSPTSSLYLAVGGHAGISRRTTLSQVGYGGCPAGVDALGCAPFAPTSDLGIGGGGTFGVGARVTPVFRFALSFTAEGGYRSDGSVAVTSTTPQTNLRLPVQVRSFQGVANLYADLGGVLNTGRWNPFVMGGLGVAANQTGDQFLIATAAGTPIVLTTPLYGSGTTQARFLWTAGAGLQYQLAPGATLDLSYQYVDAGSFRVDVNAPAGGPGQLVLQGDLRTHRLGLGVTVAINSLAQLVAGR